MEFVFIQHCLHKRFPSDEILNELTPIMKKFAPKRIPVPDVLYEYFIMRSRSNLHVVLCFSPASVSYMCENLILIYNAF